ncbi:hypothetical protein KCMC57_up62690 [Kitasatospora sp. CMC57]|uniref:Uncharacterized protein n=1 Tax=Kitasatospora sp. CMC57 TaxID=3231513 RepID=A0AB33K2T9_9ACTN
MVHTCTLPGQERSGILAVLTGARAVPDGAECAGQLAPPRRYPPTCYPPTCAVDFRSDGFSVNAILQFARHRHITCQAGAVLAPHVQSLAGADHYRNAIVLFPARTNPYRGLPARALGDCSAVVPQHSGPLWSSRNPSHTVPGRSLGASRRPADTAASRAPLGRLSGGAVA